MNIVKIRKEIYLFVLFIIISVTVMGVSSSSSFNFLTRHFADTLYCQLNGNCTLSNLVVLGNTTNLTINQQTLNITQSITLNGTSINDWSDISGIINNTDLWTNESGVATYYGNVEAKGNITLDENIAFENSAQIFKDSSGCMNIVAGNPT